MSAPSLSLRAAIADLGWFSVLFSAAVGGPSVLALLQMIFVEHRLVDALQWIVDGYNDIVAVLGAAVEPAIRRTIAWLNETFGWRLTLQPHWRPLFLLAILPATTLARDAARPGSNAEKGEPVALAIGAVVGVGVAGLAPLSGNWQAHGLMASAPVTAMLLTAATFGIVRNLLAKPINRVPFAPVTEFGAALGIGAFAFALGAGLSFAPVLSGGAGLFALAALIVAAAASSIATGVSDLRRLSRETEAPTKETRFAEAHARANVRLHRDYTDTLRIGLTMLGGFVAAGLILAADAGVRALR